MPSRHALTTFRLASPNVQPILRRSFRRSRNLSRDDPVCKDLLDETLPTTIRTLMRPTPHHLTVITSLVRTGSSSVSNETIPHGLLVSSFNTVTLDPEPYVSFNIKLPSSTLEAIKASDEFTVSGIDSPRTAEAFVKGRNDDWKAMVGNHGRLKAGMGGLWWMRCHWAKAQSVEVQDHMILVGKVIEAGSYNGVEEGVEKRLVYADGAYWRLGKVADEKDA